MHSFAVRDDGRRRRSAAAWVLLGVWDRCGCFPRETRTHSSCGAACSRRHGVRDWEPQVLIPLPAARRLPSLMHASWRPVHKGMPIWLGALIREDDDLVVNTPFPIVLRRTYNSGDAHSRGFGADTTHPGVVDLWQQRSACSLGGVDSRRWRTHSLHEDLAGPHTRKRYPSSRHDAGRVQWRPVELDPLPMADAIPRWFDGLILRLPWTSEAVFAHRATRSGWPHHCVSAGCVGSALEDGVGRREHRIRL